MQHVPRVALYLLILFGTLAATGCTAQRFTSYQSEYYDLMARKSDWDAGENKNTLRGRLPEDWIAGNDGLVVDESEIDQALVALSDEALKASSSASDLRTRIAFVRLSAMAAWQAGKAGYDRVLPITLEGQRLCDSITAKEFGAPRDCALLLGIGVLASWDQVVDDIEQFDSAWENNNLVLPESYFEQAQQVKATLDDNWKNLSASIVKLSAVDGLDDSVKIFYERQQYRAQCNYFAFLEPVDTLQGQEGFVQKARADFCAIRQDLTPRWRSENCGEQTIAWSTWCPGE
ncbi:MAG: hypothetical protein BMS9Abin01_0063 [Gammaproteobacteria bacterium]|nr:MAG: hypothetical protein BMS9Abin01_0063 [Gammaproteobacteria bacterium]